MTTNFGNHYRKQVLFRDLDYINGILIQSLEIPELMVTKPCRCVPITPRGWVACTTRVRLSAQGKAL